MQSTVTGDHHLLEQCATGRRLAADRCRQTIDADIWFFGDSPELATDRWRNWFSTGRSAPRPAWSRKWRRTVCSWRAAGGLSLVTDFHGKPLMILRSTRVEIAALQPGRCRFRRRPRAKGMAACLLAGCP